uniref:NADH-ubiquinone oxidoreductase chain 6 n=1 Tax=Plectoderini sp. SX-2018 TaxID=2507541 RepID=A0A565D7C2_9HEMI|nr:NADH dehydrogenase subunit 6 [Plectoderini sp. SX-2018]
MKTLTMAIWMNSFISPFMKHPLSLGFFLMMQTIFMCMHSSMLMSSSWYGYIMFITMIGGLMIMFMYMSSIASNEKFYMINNKINLIILMTILILMFTNKDSTLEETTKMMENKILIINNEEMKSTSKFMMKYKSNLTIITMVTLLITMISVTNISSTFEGPLKKTYV